jgi:uncharacterized protein involved in exopolysaccharide biosynthesis
MAPRLLDLLFRRKVLLAVPVVFGFLLGFAWLVVLKPKPVYFAQASVWVDRPSAINGATAGRGVLLADVTDFNPYISPAANQTGTLMELLGSKSFVVSVLGELGEVNPSLQRIQEIRKRTSVWAGGDHLVYVQSGSADSQVAAATVKAVLDQFTINFTTQLKAKAGQATGYYQAQLGVARDGLNDANNALQAYVRAHPNVVRPVTLNSSNPTTPPDPDYLKLSVNLDSARETYDRILGDFSQSQVIANTADGGTAYFYVVDQPEVPQGALRQSKKSMLMKLAAGTILGLMASAALLALLWKIDRRVRVTQDLQHYGVEVVDLPSLRLKHRRNWPKAYLRIAGALQAGFGGLHGLS